MADDLRGNVYPITLIGVYWVNSDLRGNVYPITLIGVYHMTVKTNMTTGYRDDKMVLSGPLVPTFSCRTCSLVVPESREH